MEGRRWRKLRQAFEKHRNSEVNNILKPNLSRTVSSKSVKDFLGLASVRTSYVFRPLGKISRFFRPLGLLKIFVCWN